MDFCEYIFNLYLIYFDSTRGSVQLSGSVAVRGGVQQCAVCGIAHGGVRFCVAVCGSAPECVWQCARQSAGQSAARRAAMWQCAQWQ